MTFEEYKRRHPDAMAALYRCCSTLTAHDPDEASVLNAQGWSKADGWLGKSLAAMPPDDWTHDWARTAWEMLRKYARQLLRYGIDFAAIAEPPPLDGDTRQRTRESVYTARNRRQRTISVEGNQFVVAFPFDGDVVAAIKAQTASRRFDGRRKCWLVDRDEAPLLAAFASEFEFLPDEDAAAILGEVQPLTRKEQQRVVLQRSGTVSLNGDKSRLLVQFPYDPDKVAAVRGLPGARWNKPDKVWELPTSSVVQAVAFAKRHGLQLLNGIEKFATELAAEEQRRYVASRSLTGPTTIDGLNGTMMPFQGGSVLAIEMFGNALVGHQMGLGKSVIAMGVSEKHKEYPMVVFAPKRARRNWARKLVPRWLPHRKAFECVGQKPQVIPKDAEIILVNYDIAKFWLAELKRVKPRLMVLDEGHRCKSPKAQRTQAALELATEVRGRRGRVVVLSGTLMRNRPVELIPLLKAIDKLDEFGGEWAYKMRYCGAKRISIGGGRTAWDFSGSSNIEELHEKLRKTCLIRVTFGEVQAELIAQMGMDPDVPPEPFRSVLEVEGEPEAMAEYRKAEADVVRYLMERARELAEELGENPDSAAVQAKIRAESAKHLVQLNLLRQLAAKAKLSAAQEWVEDCLNGGPDPDEPVTKALIFAHHREIVETMARTFGAPYIYGGITDKAAAKAEDAFHDDPNTRLLVLSTLAAGEALTLTEADNELFVELEWVPSDLQQAEGRAFGRLNDPHAVTAWYLLLQDSVDTDLWDILNDKAMVTSGALDGKAKRMVEGKVQGELISRLLARAS